jgi:hypothetical protein
MSYTVFFFSVVSNPQPSWLVINTWQYTTRHLKFGCRISDIRQNFILMSDIMLDSALFSPISDVPISGSVRYRWSRILDWVPTYAIQPLHYTSSTFLGRTAGPEQSCQEVSDTKKTVFCERLTYGQTLGGDSRILQHELEGKCDGKWEKSKWQRKWKGWSGRGNEKEWRDKKMKYLSIDILITKHQL